MSNNYIRVSLARLVHLVLPDLQDLLVCLASTAVPGHLGKSVNLETLVCPDLLDHLDHLAHPDFQALLAASVPQDLR